MTGTYTDYRSVPRAQDLYRFLAGWLGEHPGWAYDHADWRIVMRRPSAVANELLLHTEFLEVRLAGVLQAPDGQLIETVVGWLLPYPHSLEFRLLVEAVKLAARAQRSGQQDRAAALTLGAFTLLLLVVTSRQDSQ